MPNQKAFGADGLAYLWQRIKATFVVKVEGMGLTEINFTTADKQKLDGLTNYTLPTATSEVLGGIRLGTGFQAGENGVVNVDPSYGESPAWDDITGKPNNLATIQDVNRELISAREDITEEINEAVAGVYSYKGSVPDYGSLPTTDVKKGDVYDVVGEGGMNYGYTGTGWDALGSIFTIEYMTDAEIDAILNG